ncbi:hypothetical protein FRX31_009095 [Thalictrum thalictroides]|uniref:Uncharacterized protein n=1 Tax=Thalictrum thalictroides TaxID=46969 RepID=A0A7J6WXJ6_THATH|nr:hypothetical protein FRX31_009095 [Thalictrum thalictroides]
MTSQTFYRSMGYLFESLTRGLASLLELQIKLVSSVLDVLFQPLQWSISMDVGSNLPISDAYVPHDHRLSLHYGDFSQANFFLI